MLAAAVPGAAPLWIVATDLVHRGERLAGLSPLYVLTYAAAIVESSVLWTCLLYAA